LAEELGARAPARILLESATEREWVARCLEELGHEVIVADSNFAPMYATRTRKVKTDRRDARGIAVVALARRLAGILFALLRDGTVYEQTRRQPYDVQAAVSA
jgi:transposase